MMKNDRCRSSNVSESRARETPTKIFGYPRSRRTLRRHRSQDRWSLTFLLLLSTLSLGWCVELAAQTVAPNAIASVDTYVQEDQPNTSFGSATRMELRAGGSASAGQGRYALMGFDVGNYGSPIQTAKLRVRAKTSMPAVSLYHLPNASFGESSLTWSNMGPHIAGYTFVQDHGAVSSGGWLEFDVTGFVQSSSSAYFGLITHSTTANLSFYTKEDWTPNAARLVLYLNPAGPDLDVSRSQATDPWFRDGYSSIGNLGTIQRGNSRGHTVMLKNTGSSPLSFGSATPSIAGSSVLSVSAPNFPNLLAPGASTTITVLIRSPGTLGKLNATLVIPTLQLGTINVKLWSQVTQGRACDPGSVMADLGRVLAKVESSTAGCWNNAYLNFQWGGSKNIPLITSAVRLFAMGEPITATFFRNYTAAVVTGTVGGAGAPPGFEFLLPHELGSPNYDPISVTAILAARVWANKVRDPGLLDLTGRWLRAYFTLAAISTAPTPVKNFVDQGGVIGGYPSGFQGPGVILAGQRSCTQNWGFTTRPRLVARALGLGGNAQGAASFEAVWAALNTWWTLKESGIDLYGFTTSQKADLRGLVLSTTCPAPSTILGALSGIKTQARLEAAGWRNAPGWGLVRASTSGAVNQVNLFGTAYVTDVREANGREVHVLFPWDDPPYQPGCRNTGIGGSVNLILIGDKRMVLDSPATGPSSVDLPDHQQTFQFAIDSTGTPEWSCSG